MKRNEKKSGKFMRLLAVFCAAVLTIQSLSTGGSLMMTIQASESEERTSEAAKNSSSGDEDKKKEEEERKKKEEEERKKKEEEERKKKEEEEKKRQEEEERKKKEEEEKKKQEEEKQKEEEKKEEEKKEEKTSDEEKNEESSTEEKKEEEKKEDSASGENKSESEDDSGKDDNKETDTEAGKDDGKQDSENDDKSGESEGVDSKKDQKEEDSTDDGNAKVNSPAESTEEEVKSPGKGAGTAGDGTGTTGNGTDENSQGKDTAEGTNPAEGETGTNTGTEGETTEDNILKDSDIVIKKGGEKVSGEVKVGKDGESVSFTVDIEKDGVKESDYTYKWSISRPDENAAEKEAVDLEDEEGKTVKVSSVKGKQAGKLKLMITVTPKEGVSGKAVDQEITLDVYTAYDVEGIELKKKASDEENEETISDGKAEVTDLLIAELNLSENLSENERKEAFSYKWYYKADDGEAKEIDSGSGTKAKIDTNQKGEGTYSIVFEGKEAGNRLSYTSEKKTVEVTSKEIEAIVNVSGRNFNNTTVVSSDAVVTVEWKDRKGNTVNPAGSAGGDAVVKIKTDDNTTELKGGHLKYKSAGKVDEDTKVEVELTGGEVVFDGIDDSLYKATGIKFKEAEIKKVEMDASETAQTVEDSGIVNGNILYVKPDENGEAAVTLKSKDTYMIADQLNAPDDVSNFTTANVTCPVIEGGAVFYAKNSVGDIAKVTLDSVQPDGNGPVISGEIKPFLSNEDKTAEIEVADEGAGVDSVYYLISSNDKESFDESWNSLTADNGKYAISVSVPSSGIVHIYAKDKLGNETYRETDKVLYEKKEPSVTISGDKTLGIPTQTKTVKLEAVDEAGDEHAVSGVSEITLSLCDSENNPVAGASYALKSSDENFVVEGNKVKRASDAPETIEEAKELGRFDAEIVVSGEDLNGEYTLEAIATDYCGNTSEKTTLQTLIFDNTAPTYSIELHDKNGSAYEGTYYYNAAEAENGVSGLTVTFTDDYLSVSGGDYKVVLQDSGSGTTEAALALPEEGTSSSVNLPSEDINKLSDGRIDVLVTAVDAAGNIAEGSGKEAGGTMPAELAAGPESAEGNAWKAASFILDKTSPKLTKSETSTSSLNDVSPTSEPVLNKKKDTFIYPGRFETTITIEDENILNTECVKKYGFTKEVDESIASVQEPVADGKKISITYLGLSMGMPGRLSVQAADLAGNMLVVDSGIEQGDADPSQDHWKTVNSEEGSAETVYMRRLKHLVPLATIIYPTRSSEFVYEDNRKAYYNDKASAVITLSNLTEDDSESDEPVEFTILKNGESIKTIKVGEDGSSDKTDSYQYDITKSGDSSDSGNISYTINFTANTDGEYTFSVKGESAARYPVVVKEKSPAGNESSPVPCGEYKPYTLVIDTVSPEVELSVTPEEGSEGEFKKPELDTEHGSRFYFDKGHSFKATVSDDNFSAEQVKVSYARIGADEYTDVNDIPSFPEAAEIEGNGTYEHTDKDEGVIMYQISGTDLAGNPVVYKKDTECKYLDSRQAETGRLSTYAIVTDLTAPVFTLEYTKSPKAANNIIYFTEDREAVLTIDERTIDRKELLEALNPAVTKDGSSVTDVINEKTAKTKTEYEMAFTEEGEYTLAISGINENEKAEEIKITDLAGNEKNLKVTGDAPLHFIIDKTVPTVTIEMHDGNYDSDENGEKNYYYNKNNCAIAVTFSDGKDSEGEHSSENGKYEYSVVICTPSGEEVKDTKWTYKESESNQTKSYPVDEVSEFEDGTYRIIVTAKDPAGHMAASVSEKSAGCIFGVCEEGAHKDSPYGEFVFDKTNPLAAISIVTDGTPDRENLNEGYGNRYYFNKTHTFTATVSEANFSSKRIKVYCETGKPYNDVNEISNEDFFSSDEGNALKKDGDSNDYTWSYANEDQGVIRYRVEGTDLAGNPIVYKSGEETKYLEKQENGKIRTYAIVTDLDKPVFKLDYIESPEAVNDKYFSGDRTAVLKFVENTINHEDVLKELNLTVERDGTAADTGRNWDTKGWKTDGSGSENAMTFTEDGDYKLTITSAGDSDESSAEKENEECAITDLAGNVGTVQVAGEAPFDFIIDKTRPHVSIVMPRKEADRDGNYYYRADNCRIQVKFDDNGRKLSAQDASYEYSAVVTSTAGDVEVAKWTASPGDSDITAEKIWTPDEISKIKDGKHRICVVAKDLAGNIATAVETVKTDLNNESSGCVFKEGSKSPYGEFILDKVNPGIISIQTSPDDYPATDNKLYSDTKSVYYNKDVTVMIIVSDRYASAEQFRGFVLQDSKKTSGDISIEDTKGGITGTYKLSANHKYSKLTISGRDKAGNPLVLKPGYKHSDVDVLVQGTGDNKGSVTAQNGKVIDTVHPKVMISYTSTDKAGANIYSGETRVKDRLSAYYNQPVTVAMHFSDNYELDGEKLHAGLEGKETLQTRASGKKEFSVGGKNGTRITKDGRSVFTAYGTDRALNSTDIVEKAPVVKTRSTKKEITDNTKTTGGFNKDLTKQTPYRAMYELVLDQTAPTFSLDVNSPSSTNKDLNAQGSRYYFNGEYSAAFRVKDTNFDADKVTVKRGSITGGSYNSEEASIDSFPTNIFNQKSTFRDNVEEDGVYRYLIYGSDKAGNAIVPAEKTNLQKTMKNPDNDGEKEKGSLEKEGDISYHIVVDTKKPKGTLEVKIKNALAYKMNASGNVTYAEPFSKETSASIKIATDVSNERSPVNITYKVDSTKASDRKNVSNKTYSYKNSVETKQNGKQIFRVSEYVLTDLAGNVTKYSADNQIYLDEDYPKIDKIAPTINIVAKAKSDANGYRNGQPLFRSDVPLKIEVSDPDAENSSSGLGEVTYQMYVGGHLVGGDTKTLHNANTKTHNKDYKDEKLDYRMSDTVTVGGKSHNNNDLEVVVTALDNAGNKREMKYYFGIDVTAPTVRVTYDNNNAQNGEFFKENRTATIAVTERNFESSKFRITTQGSASISGWSHSKNGGNGDKDVWTARVTYSRDGNYTLEVNGEDLLGNKAADIKYEGVAPRKFTVDKTAPAVTVTYDNNDVRNEKYYKASRTATIDINDVNFGGQHDIVVEASGGGTAPTVNFIGNTATLPFPEDGVYIFNGTVTDKAGNQTVIPVQTEFVVDTLPPILSFEEGKPFKVKKAKELNASDHPYNLQFFTEDGFAPLVTVTDTNISIAEKDAIFEVFGQKMANRFTGTPVVHPDDNTKFDMAISAVTFRVSEEIDDVYHVRALAVDLAGNQSEVVEFDFSINRFGSSYAADRDDNADNTYAYSTYGYLRDSYYHNSTRDLTIYEYNTNALKKDSQKVEMMKDGNTANVKTLVPGTDYTFEEVPNKGSKLKTYKYLIRGSAFEEEGDYSFTISSIDEAGHNNTTSRVHRGKDEVTGEERLYVDSFPIDFVIDKTAPTNQLAGVKPGRKQSVNDRSLVVDVYPEDAQTAVNKVVIKRWLGDTLGLNIPGAEDTPSQTITYAYYDEENNPKPVDTDTEKYVDLTEYTNEETDKIAINYEIQDNQNWQWVEVITTDLAGNESEDIRAASVNSEEGIRYSENRRGFLVTTNTLSQIINNMAARVGAVAAAVLLLIILVLYKQKKDRKNNAAG